MRGLRNLCLFILIYAGGYSREAGTLAPAARDSEQPSSSRCHSGMTSNEHDRISLELGKNVGDQAKSHNSNPARLLPQHDFI